MSIEPERAKTWPHRRIWLAIVAVVLMIVAGNRVNSFLATPRPLGTVKLFPNMEDRLPDGSLFSSSTQSFLRGHHWLDSVSEVEVMMGPESSMDLDLRGGSHDHFIRLRQVQIANLVPRLRYRLTSPPDEFDAFNLMLAEYSRNGVNIAVGKSGEKSAYFETDLSEAVAWRLKGDFEFIPNPTVRPLRVGVINNCLAPGLWELSAADRAGEIYHSWFSFPEDLYYQTLSAVNRLDEGFAHEAVQWRTDPVPVQLSRLRKPLSSLGEVAISLVSDSGTGYSSQDSRRKLSKRFALVEDDSTLRPPTLRSELTLGPVYLADFQPPGKYSLESRKKFSLEFLATPVKAEVRQVTPLTRWEPDHRDRAQDNSTAQDEYIEIDIELDGYRIVLGNLPVERLVPQEDFEISGFGVGILPASQLIEQRELSIRESPAPSFAYLIRDEKEQRLALNSHEYGVEQIFLRLRSVDRDPWLEVTITSFERIVDLVKYRIEIPNELHEPLRQIATNYTSPRYLTYRDDRIR